MVNPLLADCVYLYSMDFVSVAKKFKLRIFNKFTKNTLVFTTYLKSGGRETQKDHLRGFGEEKFENHCYEHCFTDARRITRQTLVRKINHRIQSNCNR